MTETELTKQIRDLLNACNIWHWKNWSGPMTSLRGIADILGIHNRRPMAIEVKAPGWKPPGPTTKKYKHYLEQEDFLFQYRRRGGYGFFAQSAEDVIRGLGLNVKL